MLMLNRYGRKGASSRLRSLQFLPWFEKAGIECTVHPLFSDELLTQRYQNGRYPVSSAIAAYGARIGQMLRRQHFDLIWIEKEALPWLPASVEHALLRGVPYVLDYDDAIFHQYDTHRSPWVKRLLGSRIDHLMGQANLVICGNNYLAERARRAHSAKVEIVPTVIDLDRYIPERLSGADDERSKIVWIGSPATGAYLELLKGPLTTLSRTHSFKLRVIGVSNFTLPSVDVETVTWAEATEVDSLRACDIGVMPLIDGAWERGKCGYKLIQYMACGLPVVGSPVGVNTDIIRQGGNGYLATTDEEWVASLAKLLDDASLRSRFGQAGRKRVEEEYCVQQAAPRLIGLLREQRAVR